MLCSCKHCGSTFNAKRSTAKFCSEKCQKAHQRTTKNCKRLTPLQKLENSSFLRRLVDAVARSGTASILPQSPDQWRELYELHCKAAIFNYSLPPGQTVDIAHYCPSSKRGQFTVRNLGIWPHDVNNKFQASSMPYGCMVLEGRWSDTHQKVTNKSQARTLIIKLHGKTIEALRPTSLPLTNIAKQVKTLMKKTSIPFDKLISMDKASLLALLNKHGITKDEMKPAAFASTLSQVHMSEISHQLKQYGESANGLRLQQFQTLARQHITDGVYDETTGDLLKEGFDPFLLFGSLAITGKAAEALNKLQAHIEQFDLTPAATIAEYDPDEGLELSDGTVIFERIKGRPSHQLNSDQLYQWWVKQPQCSKTDSVTVATIREHYDKAA